MSQNRNIITLSSSLRDAAHATKATHATERDTQRSIVALLRRAGWLVVVTSQPSRARAQLVGLPDLIAFRHGMTLLVEVKAQHGRLRPAQVQFCAALAQHAGANLRYLVARDVGDVVDILNCLGAGQPCPTLTPCEA